MVYKEVSRVGLAEVIRRWQAGSSQRHIASGTGLSRDTVRNYMVATRKVGVRQEGPAPTEEQLSLLASVGRSGPRRARAPTDDLLAPWADQVYRWLTIDHLQSDPHPGVAGSAWVPGALHIPAPVHPAPQLASSQPPDGSDGGESARRGGRDGLRAPGVHPRPTEWPPSHGVGPDCGTGLLQAQLRLAHTQPETAGGDRRPGSGLGVLRRRPQVPGHRQLPRRGGGCRRALHPRLTRGFLEYSQHRGFITDPARVRHPKDKPHVERGVQYVRERFFKGGEFRDLAHLRDEAARWCRDVAGQRVHGTTRRQPLEVFEKEERSALAPWDGEPYEITDWRTAKVHPDHHVACQYALYSVPSALCPPGQQVEIGLGSKLVRIFHRGRLLKLHPRQPRGGRSTDPADYPEELTAYTLRAPEGIKSRAAEQGPAVAEFADRLFDGPLPWSRIRQGHKLLRLGQRYTPQRLDAACRRALEVDLIDVRRVERILVQALEHDEMPQYPPPLPSGRFARDGTVFAHATGYELQSTQGGQR